MEELFKIIMDIFVHSSDLLIETNFIQGKKKKKD